MRGTRFASRSFQSLTTIHDFTSDSCTSRQQSIPFDAGGRSRRQMSLSFFLRVIEFLRKPFERLASIRYVSSVAVPPLSSLLFSSLLFSLLFATLCSTTRVAVAVAVVLTHQQCHTFSRTFARPESRFRKLERTATSSYIRQKICSSL